jgi:putative membrane protein
MFAVFPKLNVARRLARWIVISTAYVAVVSFMAGKIELPDWALGDEVATVLGFALGILIVFRANTAYDRWWEARKQWGQLVNDTRNLALKARAYVELNAQDIAEFDRLLIAFPHALRLHLRGIDDIRAVVGFEDDRSQFPHSPGYIAGLIQERLGAWTRAGKISFAARVLDVHALALLDICGACERIQATPLASSYRSLVRWSLFLYVLIAPWWICADAGWIGLPILIPGLAFCFSMELTADVIEEPFGLEGDDLPLDQICEVIESFMRALPPHPLSKQG